MAISAGLTQLKDGGISLIFHVPYELAELALEMHKYHDQMVRIDVFHDERKARAKK